MLFITSVLLVKLWASHYVTICVFAIHTICDISDRLWERQKLSFLSINICWIWLTIPQANCFDQWSRLLLANCKQMAGDGGWEVTYLLITGGASSVATVVSWMFGMCLWNVLPMTYLFNKRYLILAPLNTLTGPTRTSHLSVTTKSPLCTYLAIHNSCLILWAIKKTFLVWWNHYEY